MFYMLLSVYFIKSQSQNLHTIVSGSNLCQNVDYLINCLTWYNMRAKIEFVNLRLFQGTIENNYFGHVLVCETLLPIMAPGGCVINVTGQLSSLRQVTPELQQVFAQAPDVATVSAAMKMFVEKAQTNEHRQYGFSNSCLGMSKLGVMAVARIHAHEMASKNVRNFSIILRES